MGHPVGDTLSTGEDGFKRAPVGTGPPHGLCRRQYRLEDPLGGPSRVGSLGVPYETKRSRERDRLVQVPVESQNGPSSLTPWRTKEARRRVVPNDFPLDADVQDVDKTFGVDTKDPYLRTGPGDKGSFRPFESGGRSCSTPFWDPCIPVGRLTP